MESLKYTCWKNEQKICFTCKFCNEYAVNVYHDNLDYVPHGYDGSAICDAYDSKDKTSDPGDNRLVISPMWKQCKKYVRCSERQALFEEIYDPETNTVIENPHPPIKFAH